MERLPHPPDPRQFTSHERQTSLTVKISPSPKWINNGSTEEHLQLARVCWKQNAAFYLNARGRSLQRLIPRVSGPHGGFDKFQLLKDRSIKKSSSLIHSNRSVNSLIVMGGTHASFERPPDF